MHKHEGKVMYIGTWTLSEDGKTLAMRTVGNRLDGRTFKREFLFKRIVGSVGLAGTWESTKPDPDRYPDWQIDSYEGDGLAFFLPAIKQRYAVKFDGKDYPVDGPAGATMAGERIDARTVELTDKLKGRVKDTQIVQSSANGKTMTVTTTFPGKEQKEMDVYQRQ